MARARRGSLLPSTITVAATAIVAMVLIGKVQGECQKVPVIFNFGDSNSDTGGYAAGYGTDPVPPSGRRFFRQPAGRVCDGRLVIDFLCESVNASYLSPYLEALGSNFTNGANFAIAGSHVAPNTDPLDLEVQTREFHHFRTRSLALLAQGRKEMMGEEGFRSAVYTYDIGQNDISGIMGANLTFDQKLGLIRSFGDEIGKSINSIYALGGRNFWIHNTGPLGCLPQSLATYNKNGSNLDPAGCLASFNDFAMAFNSHLDDLCGKLRLQLSDATIVYNDVYSIKYDIISNYTKYGFDQALMVCCGHGGPPYNYDSKILCQAPGCAVCPEAARFVSWDGVHYTEAANQIVASKLLSMDYSKPRISFQSFCGA